MACRNADAKRRLLRVVRLADGAVAFDPKGKAPGRGAYVCADASCIQLARKQKKLERSLKVSGLSDDLYRELERQLRQDTGENSLQIGQASLNAEELDVPDAARRAAKTQDGDGRTKGQLRIDSAGECGTRPQESEE